MELEPEVFKRIKFHRRKIVLTQVSVLLPLAFGVAMMVALSVATIVQERAWLLELGRKANPAVANIVVVILLILPVVFGLLAGLATLRRNKPTLPEVFTYNQSEYSAFRTVVDGLCIAAGIESLPIAVLGLPNIETMAFRVKGKPMIGVTAAALEAKLPAPHKEAMAAHEVAHVMLGDSLLASGKGGYAFAASALLTMLVFYTILAALVSFNLLFVLAPVIYTIVFAAYAVTVGGRLTKRHDDLLVDSVAVRLTNNPAALREVVEKYYKPSGAGDFVFSGDARFPGQVVVDTSGQSAGSATITISGTQVRQFGGPAFLGMTQPIQITVGDTSTGVMFRDAEYQKETVQKRIYNLRAIEEGRPTELEKPLWRENLRSVVPLIAVLIVMTAITLAIVIPWKGKSAAWEFLTTNFITKTQARQYISTTNTILAGTDTTRSLKESVATVDQSVLPVAAAGGVPSAFDFEMGMLQARIGADVTIPLLKSARDRFQDARNLAVNDEYNEYTDLMVQILDLRIKQYQKLREFIYGTQQSIQAGTATPQGLVASIDALKREIRDSDEEQGRLWTRARVLVGELDLD